jgi:uncharacterized protein DUF6487
MMPDESIFCPKCKAPMQEGYILEDSEGRTPSADKWIEGAPEYSPWFGILQTKNRKKYHVTTYRCARCGHLESYALLPAQD